VDTVSAYKHSHISYDTLREAIVTSLPSGHSGGLMRNRDKFYYCSEIFDADNIRFSCGIEIQADTNIKTGLIRVCAVVHTADYDIKIISAKYRPIPLKAHNWRFRLKDTIKAALEYNKKIPTLYQKKGIKAITLSKIKLEFFNKKWELLWDDGLPIAEIKEILENEFKERQNLLAGALALAQAAELKIYYDTPSMRDRIRQYAHQVIVHG